VAPYARFLAGHGFRVGLEAFALAGSEESRHAAG
jgi:hypothetical protein